MTPSPRPSYAITTAIDYVNAPPHLGHAYEKIAADVMARFQRLMGRDVFFLTGSDEHGAKVAQTAATQGLTPPAYVDAMAARFQQAWKSLHLSHNRFIRTTEPAHYAVVESLWRQMVEKGDIYKASYTARYCSGCESFLTDRDLDDQGQCRIHRRAPEPVAEENWFFRLTRYKDDLRALIDSGTFVRPAFRVAETLNMLEELEDISVSRPKTSVAWGIPVPDDPDQTIYVWIDALSNYVTGLGLGQDAAQFERYWPADCHLVGKDILRFHALYWPAMLMSAGLAPPRSVFAHGFINLNDAKISKSLGNVVCADDLMTRFSLPNPDAIRYYLMTATTFGQDGNFTEDDFKRRVNANLANNLGNLLNRALNMTQKYFDGRVPTPPGLEASALYVEDAAALDALRAEYDALEEGSEARAAWKTGYHFPQSGIRFLAAPWRANADYLSGEAVARFADDIRYKYELFDFEFALFTLFERIIAPVNLFIDEKAPWTLAKNGETERLAAVLYSVLERLRQIALLLSPVCPSMAAQIWSQLGDDVDSSGLEPLLNGRPARWEALYDALEPGRPIRLTGPILPRLDDDLAGPDGKKKKP
ncbi:MAG: methionine--tRNA ligase [Vampirovibrionales bacterium]|nr:methionine--tRNA ligase [Vampirovibrionales bacterium]